MHLVRQGLLDLQVEKKTPLSYRPKSRLDDRVIHHLRSVRHGPMDLPIANNSNCITHSQLTQVHIRRPFRRILPLGRLRLATSPVANSRSHFHTDLSEMCLLHRQSKTTRKREEQHLMLL